MCACVRLRIARARRESVRSFAQEVVAPHAADIDNKMQVDVTDLLYVLKHYDKECPKQKRGFFG